MINRLINIDTPILSEPINKPIINNNIYSIKDYATAFINGMSDTQKARFKKMLESGITCGVSVAYNYGINYDEFIYEVKKQMGVV